MSSRCRFCGGKVPSDASSCEHCGKQLRKPETVDEQERPRLNNLESWKGTTIPSWLMFLVVGIFLACFVIMFLDAAPDPEPVRTPAPEATQPAEQLAPENTSENEAAETPR